MRVVNFLIFINRFFLFHAKTQRPRKGAKNAKVCQHFFFAPLRELCAFARKNSYSTQSAMNTFVSPDFSALRLDANTSFFPSGENIGNPSNVSLKVIRSKPVPSTLIL